MQVLGLRRVCFRALIGIGAGVFLLGAACTESPEKTLVGCWKEVDARYEKLPKDGRVNRLWSDGVRVRDYPTRDILRHESEAWEFRPGGEVQILGRNGKATKGRWRLKGRGHVMTVRFPATQAFEVYDIKELDQDRLVLHYDSGMEVRGVARLEFQRQPSPEAKVGSCVTLKPVASRSSSAHKAHNNLGDAS